MSDAIFIVGYYRSGTSALSGALQKLGVQIFNEADPNEHNPLGFYEIPELIEFDVDLFSRLGVEWTDVRGLAAGWWDRADIASFLTRLDEILRRRFSGEAPVWALKHPHLCRLLPIYERAARQAGHRPHVVHIFRDPWTAAASQQRKNGLSRAHAMLLWMSYVTSGERAARHLPRSWLTYHDLLAKPDEQLRRIEQDTGIGLSRLTSHGMREAAAYLNGQLNRSLALPHEDLARPLRDLVTRTWAAVLARNFMPQVWDGFAEETADMVGFLTEIGSSRGKVIPAFGGGPAQVVGEAPETKKLRPAERVDAGAKLRLHALAEGVDLPSVAVVIVAPAGRAPAANDTLESLRGQWHPASAVKLLAADEVDITGLERVRVGGEAGELSRRLCAELNAAAASADYVAVLNAGDTVAPDACLRFALEAAQTGADLLYCDEIVPREGGAWVRHKPGWDVTRLRQSAYLGDWVWYRGVAVLGLGGFDALRAGAEEYDLQLRLAETPAKAARLPEALFTRSAASRRDSIPADIFCARAADAITGHLWRQNMTAQVQNRQHLGLFHHVRDTSDPGTSLLLLCDGVAVVELHEALTGLLSANAVSGPVILAGAALDEGVTRYLQAVAAQPPELAGKVLAVLPEPGMSPSQALRRALDMASTELVAIVDARARSASPYWAEALRSRLADPGVAIVAGRALVALANDPKKFSVQGPVVIGAQNRLGAGHLEDDPGPGGWLIVDQEASAVAPPALLTRRAALAACEFPALEGDALWIDLCAQLRAAGSRIVWTPDVSFTAPAAAIRPDSESEFRRGGAAARTLPWADAYHHPALSLQGDLLASELRLGLVRTIPADPASLLLSGPPDTGAVALNAARALRRAGVVEADWAPEPLTAAELGRREPAAWVRVNPGRAAAPLSPGYAAVFSAAPAPEAKPAITGAAQVYATSPELVRRVRKLAAPGQAVTLWRPALSAAIWQEYEGGNGLNTRPRVLWIDEGIAPAWLAELINKTLEIAAWIVVEQAGSTYTGAVARIRAPATEADWALALSELGPQILVRPAAEQTEADHGKAMIAAAVGCYLLVDDRLDLPETLGAVRLPNKFTAWEQALQNAIRDLTGTLAHGKRAREAALALPSVEAEPPPWARIVRPSALLRSAAE